MAIVEEGVFWPMGACELIQALCDQEAADAVARHKCKLALEEVQAPERRELIEHQQEFLPAPIGIQALGQPTSDLIEHEAHQRLGAGDIGGWYDQVQGYWLSAINQITNAPIAPSRHLGNHGVSVEPQKTHCGRQHARTLVLAF